ncbi:MauE/DoxX family redox-associated membrane protein [Mesonia aquimarina]|uniref:MauE/DoxX family redox-associated membrane protein n=1 Tax=Mesonia aquimarina TaxID=1504967 RepID=UPI000EF57B17|nr:MauE/DoxX family redox-associated membrane protein [Mesonia aquimarina]
MLKTNLKTRNLIVRIVSYLFVLLFVYAAVSKMIDFEVFRSQLSQSPLLTNYSSLLVFIIPFIEILIAIALLLPKLQYFALYASGILMLLFSLYIVAILNFSPSIPCSCGGILENLGWEQHLYVNLIFVVLAFTASFLHQKCNFNGKRYSFLMIGILISCIVIIGSLLLGMEEKKMLQDKSFKRTYLPDLTLLNTQALPYNSYYLAGTTNDSVYLGNSTGYLTVVAGDLELTSLRYNTIKAEPLPKTSIPKLSVLHDYFYLIDGSNGIILKGKHTDWQAHPINKQIPYFNAIQVLPCNKYAIRVLKRPTQEQELALFNPHNLSLNIKPDILTKRSDGIFDLDGMFSYNAANDKVIYTFFYQSKYIVLETDFSEWCTFKTEVQPPDNTFSEVRVSSGKEKVPSKQLTPIHKTSTSYGNYHYISNNIQSQSDSPKTVKTNTIIDIYQLDTGTYQQSIKVPSYNHALLKQFEVTDNYLIALYERTLVTYKLPQEGI